MQTDFPQKTNFELERTKYYAAEQAKVIGVVEDASGRAQEITLFWPVVDEKAAESGIRFLTTYTSSLNYPQKRFWVDNPIGSIEKYSGRYRQIRLQCGKHDENPGIIMVLRRGMLQSLPLEEAQETESRLYRVDRDPNTGKRTIVRYWRNVDREYVKTCEAQRGAMATVTDPRVDVLSNDDTLVNTKTYTGLWVPKVWAEPEPEGDVTFRVWESLTEATEVNAIAALYGMTPEIRQGHNSIQQFAFSNGATQFIGDDFYISLTYRGITRGSRQFLMGITPTTLEGIVNSDDSSNLQDYPEYSAAGVAYAVGDIVTVGTVKFICTTAITTSSSFATEIAAGKWAALCGGSFWLTLTGYNIGDVVSVSTGVRYYCATAHTSGTFATDLAAGNWVVIGDWRMADRKWQPEENGTGSFAILFKLRHLRHVNATTGLSTLKPEIIQGNEVANLFSDYTADIVGTGDLYDLAFRYRGLTTGSRAWCQSAGPGTLTALILASDFEAWVTGTAYVVGDVVIVSTTRYICLTAHTAGTWATDLAAAKWVALADWKYANRKFTDDQDGSATFTVLFRRARWNTGITEASALIVDVDDAVGGQRASMTRIWFRRSYAAMVTLTTAVTGAARIKGSSGYTSHLSCRVTELGDGAFNVTQVLVNPKTRIDVLDTESSQVHEAHVENVMLTAGQWSMKIVVTWRTIEDTAQKAATYAGTSGQADFFDPTGNVSMKRGRFNYIGNNKWAAYKVYVRSAWSSIDTEANS